MRAAGLLLGLGLLASAQASAESLSTHRPEAWAMRRAAAASQFAALDAAAAPAPWRWDLGLELGHIPRLDDEAQRIGFDGSKREDLNKSPLFGRLRLRLGLPAHWLLEAGWTPPVSIDGAHARDLFGLALARDIALSERWRLQARLAHQRGDVIGDFTCYPETVAQAPGSAGNPYGCRAPSSDRYRQRVDRVELALVRTFSGFDCVAGLSRQHASLSTRVDARVFDGIDNTELEWRGGIGSGSLGCGAQQARWAWHVGLQWTPLALRRPGESTSHDDLWSLRIVLRRMSDFPRPGERR